MPALEAVLEDASSQGGSAVYCLGDIVGFGGTPRECVVRAMQFDLNLMGDHDESMRFEPVGYNPSAKAHFERTKQQLTSPDFPRDENRKIWSFLTSLPESHAEDGVLYVHGSPRDPVHEYVFDSDVRNREKLDQVFADLRPERICFHGHTLKPGIMTSDYSFLDPTSFSHRFKVQDFLTHFPDLRLLINVGSVGQPRDGDARASYVLFDGTSVEFRRVDYESS